MVKWPSEKKNSTIKSMIYKRIPRRRRVSHHQSGRAHQRQSEFAQSRRARPDALEDFILREKITHFDHERIPERVVHARGSAAHGYFQVYESMAEYTKAGFSRIRRSRHRSSCASRQSRVRGVRLIWPATCAALPSSFTRRKGTTISSATTSRSSSFRMR